jgi:Zn finger protein HypA/HybF involved in hydrogenase expression
MHELGIARVLIDTAQRSAELAGLTRVRRLGVELGPAAALSAESLAFAIELVGRGTLVEGAAVEVTGGPDAVRLLWIDGE